MWDWNVTRKNCRFKSEPSYIDGMQNGIREWLLRKDTVWLQAVKYIGCGGIAVLVDQLLFYGLAAGVAGFAGERSSGGVVFRLGLEAAAPDEAMLERNYWLIKGICFVVANAVVYLLNRKFVFEAGRHRSGLEVALFFGASLLQFGWIGLGGVLITRWAWEVTYANVAMMMAGALTNFVFRKFVVFQR